MTRALLIAALAGATSIASAQPAPAPVAAAGVDERVGAQLPLDTAFTAVGRGRVTLRDLLDGERPALLVLAYARCTMLCSLVLRGVSDVAKRLARAPGRDYQLVLIGLDAAETLDEASRKQATLLAELGRAGDRAAWPYLVGERPAIDAVAQALGFRYRWDPRTQQYAHPAVIFALAPDGRVARYLHGLQFDPAEVDAALADAAAGRMLSTAAAEVLRCFRFDPAARRAGAMVERVLRGGGALVFLLLVGTITGLVLWERRRGRRS